jgi:hypothetical protein
LALHLDVTCERFIRTAGTFFRSLKHSDDEM